ncbi:hypothetical protein DGM98_20960 [Xanthomonas citri]|uniref:Uncharacterized protein n=1 Tax=Xanthomonas citri pv. phaseoli var. fuscans TaxID=473423 RepID=A0AB33FE49_XANCI|nr:hypothetical protein DGM98_20960 [Xanthomonas citri]
MTWRRRGLQHPQAMPVLRSRCAAGATRVAQHRRARPGVRSALQPTAPSMHPAADQRARQTPLPQHLRRTAGHRRLSSHSALRAKSPNPSAKVCAKPSRAPSAACVRE